MPMFSLYVFTNTRHSSDGCVPLGTHSLSDVPSTWPGVAPCWGMLPQVVAVSGAVEARGST